MDVTGLVSSIITFIDFSWTIVRGTYDLHNSASDATAENVHIGIPVIHKLHLDELRRIQPLEGFPESFELHRLSNKVAHMQMGNAEPLLVVEWTGRAVAEQYRQASIDEDDCTAAKTPQELAIEPDTQS
ncbi:hypothetical protein UCDDA912_g00298 [Diaporthe ampelina]|uniref:Uncharacterized protein n=1 Tax=Diaporthe ampelina TaxID=1214573 RepID=A0A0G2IGH2_9PEZI|nr:hypothetical protein UCDDA912_g00298 [Diaporthe ampelina]